MSMPIMAMPSRCLYSLSLTRVTTTLTTVGHYAMLSKNMMSAAKKFSSRSLLYFCVCMGANVAAIGGTVPLPNSSAIM